MIQSKENESSSSPTQPQIARSDHMWVVMRRINISLLLMMVVLLNWLTMTRKET